MRQIFFLLMLFGMAACTSQGLDEARAVVAQADSVRAEGRMYDDSLQLAQAYTVLGRHRRFHADEYAHACYHYGRLLREKEDPAAAMQCFIRATHSHTHDLPILGRVYSNMGSICHLAGDYPMAYDMYERSSKIFLQNGDTTNYFYALYSMALEKAELADSATCVNLLQQIDTHIEPVYSAIPHAKLHLKCRHFDSAIYYIRQADVITPTNLIITAQAYSYLGMKDSSTYYANKVMLASNSIYDINNALYILTNDDESRDKISIRAAAAERADIQKILKIRQGKLSQAVQLLEMDLHKRPNYIWLCGAIVCLCMGCAVLYWRNRYQHQMHKRVEQLVERQTDTVTQSIKQHIDKTNLTQTLHWKDYSTMKADADLYMGSIVSKLEQRKLNETEIRFCLLTMLDFPLVKIADKICYSYPSAIKTLKKRIATKLGVKTPELREFLFHLAANS